MADTWKDLDDIARKKEICLDTENLISSELYEKTKEDIRETDTIRVDSLIQFRNWIQQNQDIENCITDDSFLLRFLRVRKHSLPMAQQTLLKYLHFRQKFSRVMYNLDYTKDGTSDLINRGYSYPSPFRDLQGRRVVFYNIKKIDLEKNAAIDVQRLNAITFETLIEDETNQVMGITHVIYAGNAGAAYVPFFLSNDFGLLIKLGQQTFPMRQKEFNVVDVSSYGKYVFDTVKLVLSTKLRSRICFGESLENIQKKLGKQCLPLELGGVVPEKDMIKLFQEDLAAKRDRLLSYDKIRLLSDRGIITRRNCPTEDKTGSGSLAGSFRKLEID